MADAFGLLGIDKDVLNDFCLQALRIDDLQIEKVVKKNVVELKRIQSRLADCENVRFNSHSVDDVIKKVQNVASGSKGKQETWTGQELRILSYYLVKLQQDQNTYKYALSLLSSNWKDLYFNGLVLCVMASWNELLTDFRQEVCSFIISKLQRYSGNNSRYEKMKSHVDYFEETGPVRMSDLLKNEGISILDAPMVLGKKQVSLSQSYYSDVIINYYKKKLPNLTELENVFQVHSYPRTKKLLFAELVDFVDAIGKEFEQVQLSKFIEKQLGNVTIKATWAPFAGATEEEIQKLKNAQRLVQMWLTRKIIETFFEICVTDLSRKQFWLQYVQYVEKFKVIGSLSTKQLLESDPRINNLNGSFIQTNSRVSQTSALVLCIGDSVIVEFSNVGALYVYKKNNEKVQFLKSGDTAISSIEELKNPSMKTNNYSSVGELRMVHSGEWESRLHHWLWNNIKCLRDTDKEGEDDQDLDYRYLPIDYITIRCKSKWIFDGKCQVIASDEGFYLMEKDNSIHFLARPKICAYFDVNYETNSRIILKSIQMSRKDSWMHEETWYQVLFSIKDTEISICYLKKDWFGDVYCKTELYHEDNYLTKIK